MPKRIAICVTNNIRFDQRISRFSGSLKKAGYEVLIIGRDYPEVHSSQEGEYYLHCIKNKGPFFYLEYNLRLYQKLKLLKPELIIACDLDTVMGAGEVASQMKIPWIYDAHEWFTEVPELHTKNIKKKIWNKIGRKYVPAAQRHFTVAPILAEKLSEKYQVKFNYIFNVPLMQKGNLNGHNQRDILYQGVLNKGRGLEILINTMQHLPEKNLILAGEGDLSQKLRKLKDTLGLKNVIFKGKLLPEELKILTKQCWIGINLLEDYSLSYYYSLANKFFDYLHAGLPSINMKFPEYDNIFSEYLAGVLIEETSSGEIIDAIKILESQPFYNSCRGECLRARAKFNWQKEEKKLLELVQEITGSN